MKLTFAKKVFLLFVAATAAVVVSREQAAVCLAPTCVDRDGGVNEIAVAETVATPELSPLMLEERALALGRQAATRTFGLLSSNLQHAIKTTGITNALPYCSVLADPLTQQVAKELNADIRRVTHRPRNPKGAASAEELELIQRHTAQLAKDTNAAAPTLVTNAPDRVVFYAPIVITNALCLQCHGAPGTDIRPETLAAIGKFYPRDQATGFKLGDLRGLWRVEFSRTSLVSGR